MMIMTGRKCSDKGRFDRFWIRRHLWLTDVLLLVLPHGTLQVTAIPDEANSAIQLWCCGTNSKMLQQWERAEPICVVWLGPQ
jgi:hypothetical protein